MSVFDKIGSGLKQAYNWVSDRVRSLWNDFTGQTAIDKQNLANMELAKYQAQVNEDFYNKYSSPEAMMRQYREAGLNPNLVYGSAGAGQSNVPSFSAPHVERGMTGADKINKVLSVISAVNGIMQGVYQTDAAREAAEQSALKTMSDRLSLAGQRWDLTKLNTFLGGDYVYDDYVRRWKDRKREFVGPQVFNAPSGTYLDQYFKAVRENEINKLVQPVFQNQYDYGYWYGSDGKVYQSQLTPYMMTRNKANYLKYELTNELGNTGTYGKLLLSLFGLFK